VDDKVIAGEIVNSITTNISGVGDPDPKCGDV